MSRVQFMEQLKKLLADISEEERQEALAYYENYFDDAGEEQEAKVIRELGSPGKVAAIIKEDLKNSAHDYGEFTEQGFQDERTEDNRQMPQSRAERGYHAERKGGKASVILVLILLVFISPLIKGTVGGIFGIIVTLILLPFLITFGIGAAVIGLFVAAVGMIGAGIGMCVSLPAFGVLAIGLGLILLALALAGVVFVVWVASKALPAVLRKFTDFCGRIVNRGRKEGGRA